MVRFDVSCCSDAQTGRLRDELGVSGPLAQVLVRRGLAEPAAARAFLDAGERHELDTFAGMARAAELVCRHVREGSRITIHGDYDVDGVCATAILVRALRRLGASRHPGESGQHDSSGQLGGSGHHGENGQHASSGRLGAGGGAVVDWHIPARSDGYGLSLPTVRRLAERGTRLLITADCGITAVEEVAAARALGIDVIVSDHHSPRADGTLPDCMLVHPALGGYPCAHLCGAAVAHKLAQAVWRAAGRDEREMAVQDQDLVGLATIADLVPLRGENRTLARAGLRALAVTTKPGLRALMAVARVDPGSVSERAVGFALAPRLNAAGRLYRADAALELLLTEDAPRAAQIADELDRANSERRLVEQRIRAEAEKQLAARGEGGWAHVLWGEGWHPGVIGIVAARLVESCGRPVVMIALDGERGRGSARSIAPFDLLGGLSACGQHLLGYGGHAAAAGLEIERDRVEDFARAFEAHAAELLCEEDLVPVERVDAVVGGAELGMELAEELAALAPFGKGNPSVSLMVNGARLCDIRPMGEGRHARFTVRSQGVHAQAVAFGRSASSLGVAEGELALATFTLEVNEWKGAVEPRLVLRHAAPAPEDEATIDPCPTATPAQHTLFDSDQTPQGEPAALR